MSSHYVVYCSPENLIPGKHSVFTYAHIILPSGEDFDCLFDSFSVPNINVDNIVDVNLSS